MKSNTKSLTEGPLAKQILLVSLPLALSNLLQVLFNMSDVAVVGRFAGSTALGAVGSTSIFVTLFTGFLIGLSNGINVLVARFYGARHTDDVRRTVHSALVVSLIAGVVLLFVGLLGSPALLRLLNTKEDLLPGAILYLRVYFLGMPALALYNFGNAIFSAIGDTKKPLYFLSIAGVLNILLNLFFVIVCHLDVVGVALASAISQCVSAFLVLRALTRVQDCYALDFHKVALDPATTQRILALGLPAGFQGILFSLSNVVIQSSVNIFGNIVVAGNSAAANLEGFVYMAMNAFYQTTLSFVSQNYGAGEQKRIHRIVLLGEACVIVTGTLLGNAVVFFGNELLHIYSGNPEVIAAGIVRLHYISMVYALCGIMDVMVGALRGIGYSVMPMIVSIVGVCVLRLVWLATVFQIPAYHRIETVYLSYPVTWILTSLVYIVFFIWVRVRTCRKSAAA